MPWAPELLDLNDSRPRTPVEVEAAASGSEDGPGASASVELVSRVPTTWTDSLRRVSCPR